MSRLDRLKRSGQMNNFQDMKKRAEMMGGQHMGSLAPNLLASTKVTDLVDMKCIHCQGEIFHPAHTLKFASQFQTRNGVPTMVQFPLGFACSGCGEINPFAREIVGGPANTDQDGQKSKEKTETKEVNAPAPDLGVSVSEEVKPKEKLN